MRGAKANQTYLLFSNHPLATKLARTTSAWVFVIDDVFRKLTSRKAAKEETQYDSLGASIICSTCTYFNTRLAGKKESSQWP